MPRKRSNLPWLDERNGIFYVFEYNPVTRRTDRRSLKTDNEAVARGKFAAYLTGGRTISGERADRDAGLKAGTALDDYFNEHIMLKSDDIPKVKRVLIALKQHFADVLVRDIDIPMCRGYVDRRVRGEIRFIRHGKVMTASPGYCRVEMSYLVAAINHARRWKRITLADVPFIELPPSAPARTRHLSYEELAKLRETADEWSDKAVGYERVKWFIELAYYTAGRRASIERMNPKQISLDLNRINLAKEGERKTKKRRPIVAIHPELRPTVELLLKRYGQRNYILGSAACLSSEFREVADAAGLHDVTPHTLRHSRATHLLWQGVDIWTVAKLLGDTVQTVERVYGHHCPEFMEKAMQRSADSGA